MHLRKTRRSLVAVLLSSVSLSLASAVEACAQSTDFSRPTPVTAVPVVGEHDGTKGASYFYSVEAGPGSILVTYDGHTSKYSTNTQLNVYDANRNSLGQIYLVAKDAPSSETKRINLSKRQKVVFETVLKPDPDIGLLKYAFNVSGAVQLSRPTGEATTSTSQSSSTSSSSSSAARPGRVGRLHIELRDGTTKDFDMSSVRRVTIE